MQYQSSVEVKGAQFGVPSKWGVVILCALQMYYLVLEFYRHWSAMSSSSRALLVAYLMVYPLPLLHLMRKNINPFVTAILVYVTFGITAILIFPMVP